MSINHILLRPQVLQRPISGPEQRLGEELMEMASRLISDGIQGGRARQKFLQGTQMAFQFIVDDFKTRIDMASQAVSELVKPLLEAFKALGASLGNLTSPMDAIQGISRLILMAADILKRLSPEQIGAHLLQYFKLFTEVLGLTKERITDFLNRAVDVVVQKMKSDFLAGDQGEQSHNEFLIGCYLEKIKRFMAEDFPSLGIDFDLSKVAAQVAAFLKGMDWDAMRKAAEQMLREVATSIKSMGLIFDNLSGTFKAAVKVPGVAANAVSWYATYYQRKLINDVSVGVANRDLLLDEAFFKNISFKHESLSPKMMEAFAQFSDVFVSAAQAMLHKHAKKKLHRAANQAHTALQTFNSGFTVGMGASDDVNWVKAHQALHNNYFDVLSTLGISMLSGLENYHPFKGEEQGNHWLAMVGKDATEALLYKNWPARLRQGLMSIMTLLNSDLAAKPESLNHTKVEGLAMLVSEAFSWVFASFSDRKNFGLPAQGGIGSFIGLWLTGAIGAWVGALAGGLLGWAISCIGKPAGISADKYFPGAEVFGLITVESLVTGILKHPLYNYFWYNGDTDSGRFGKDNSSPPLLKTFQGYPKGKSKSPYKLPYPKGVIHLCAQGNLGLWSHGANSNQVYAYDWDHDHGSEVLAMRAGTVALYSDVMPDHSTLQHNHLHVRHDAVLEGPVPNPVFDRDWTDRPVITTGKYLHGKHFGIRHIFAALGIPARFIPNTPVSQGQLVMYSGDTGKSFFNHLHAHVSSSNAESVPFIFQDSTEEDGRLKDFTWYESGNERIPDPVGLTLAQPSEQCSLTHYTGIFVASATPDTVALRFSESSYGFGSNIDYKIDDIFNGCVLVWVRPNLPTVKAEVGKGKYNPATGQVEVKLRNNWGTTPARGDQLSIMSLAREATPSTLVLDAYADFTRDDYSNASILVWWTTNDGIQIHQYKKITSYDKGTRKVTIEGTWDRVPEMFAEFEIGQRSYAQASPFKRRFAFVKDDAAGPGMAPAYLLANTACSYAGHYSDVVAAFPGLGSDQLTLAASAPADPSLVNARFVCISTGDLDLAGSSVLGMREIKSYNPSTRTITVDRAWDFPIVPASHRYTIGTKNYAQSNADEKDKAAFLAPDTDANAYTPSALPDGRKPYQSLTYKMWN
ncbi:MAG: hypothetical protein RLZZ165_168 [Bacteroidota bacterium]